MNLKQLRTFIAIAEAGGLARAQGRLHLSQPAASRQIQSLEAALGVPLFDRVGRRMPLTAEGEDLLRRTRRVLQDVDSIAERARALKGGNIGTLRVGATPQVIETPLSSFLAQHRRRHAGVEVHLVEEGGAALPARLEAGDIHLALMVYDERFRARPLYPVYALAILPKNHRLGRRRTLDVAALPDEPLLLPHRTFASRVWFETACRVAHVDPRVVLESGAPATIIALVATGYGIGVLPSTVHIPRDGVVAIPLVQGDAALGRWLTVAWNERRFLAPYAERFIDGVVAYCRRHHPGREILKRAPPLARPKLADG